MKTHLILEPTIWFRVRAFVTALWMSLSRLLAVFSSKKTNIKEKK